MATGAGMPGVFSRPEARARPHRWGTAWPWVAVAAAAIIVAATAIAVEETRIRDLDEALSATGREQTQQVSELEAIVERRSGALAELRTELREARSFLGVPLDDGEHQGMIHMLGGTQTPPMLAFDDEVMFFQDEAVAAAIEDGMDPEEARAAFGMYAHYFRNVDPEWRILPISPDVEIVLESYRFQRGGGFHSELVSLERFDRIYHSEAPQKDHFRLQHYVIVVRDWEVVEIHELNLSP